MKRSLIRIVLVVSAVSSMAFTMPSCPGQEAMQNKIDNLQASNGELNKRILKLESQMTGVDADMNQIKQVLPQMSNVIQAQKGAIDQVGGAVQAIQARMNKGKVMPAKGGQKAKPAAAAPPAAH